MTPWGPYGPIWGPMGSMGLGRWAMADGPWPMGLEDPPVGVYFRARGRWASRTPPWGYISRPEADGAPWAPWASGTSLWGYHLVNLILMTTPCSPSCGLWCSPRRLFYIKKDSLYHYYMIFRFFQVSPRGGVILFGYFGSGGAGREPLPPQCMDIYGYPYTIKL